MTQIKSMIEQGRCHPEAGRKALEPMKLYNIYDESKSGWYVVEKGPGRKITPMGDSNGPFRYETEQEAQEDIDALKLFAQETVGNG